jgi:hypothetical protein
MTFFDQERFLNPTYEQAYCLDEEITVTVMPPGSYEVSVLASPNQFKNELFRFPIPFPESRG